MSLFETIEKDYVQAYKAKDAVRLTVLRLLKTAVKNRLVDLCRPGGTLDDAEMLDLIHAGVRFDFGYVYSASLADLIQIPRNYINNSKTSKGASTLAKKVELSEKKLPALLEAFETLE